MLLDQVDDVLLEMVPGVMPDSVVSACSVLDGVSVLWINRYAAGANLYLVKPVAPDLLTRVAGLLTAPLPSPSPSSDSTTGSRS